MAPLKQDVVANGSTARMRAGHIVDVENKFDLYANATFFK
jgi:hypothetical protein